MSDGTETIIQPDSPHEPAKHWPQVPPVNGGLYSFSCPTHGTRMMAMNIETFLDFRQGVDRMRTELTDQKAMNIKLFQEKQDLAARLEAALTAKPDKGNVVRMERRLITPGGGEVG
jgi:hypothetical protein